LGPVKQKYAVIDHQKSQSYWNFYFFTEVQKACKEYSGVYGINENMRKKHYLCFLCPDNANINAISFCKNANKSFETWLQGWQLQRSIFTDCTNNFINNNSIPDIKLISYPERSISRYCEHNNISSERPTRANFSRGNCSVSCCKFADVEECNDLFGYHIFVAWACITGVLTLSGNTVVVVTTLRLLNHEFYTMPKVQRVHNLLLLNLATSDFLMGAYSCFLGLKSILAHTSKQGYHEYDWRGTTPCSLIGVINFVSSQVSVTLLVIMTSFRLYSITHPYRGLSTRLVVYCIVACWVLWVLVAFIPLIKRDWIKLIFGHWVKLEVLLRSNNSRESFWINYDVLKKPTPCVLAIAVSQNYSRSFALPETPYWYQLARMPKNLHDDKSGNFYNDRAWCAMDYFDCAGGPETFYRLAIILFNLMAFLYIASVYSYLMLQTAGNCKPNTRACLLFSLSGCCHSKRQANAADLAPASGRLKENRKMQRLMFAIIATDFICWVPLCLAALWHFGNVDAAHMKEGLPWENISSSFSVFIIPTNSLINPFLHSARLRNICKKFFKRNPHP